MTAASGDYTKMDNYYSTHLLDPIQQDLNTIFKIPMDTSKNFNIYGRYVHAPLKGLTSPGFSGF
jgi:hypothetical protein